MQGSVWQEVDMLQEQLAKKVGGRVRAPQSQSSLQLTLENNRVSTRAADYVRELSPIVQAQDDAIGYAFAINGQLQGAELYAAHGLFQKQWQKLLHANAIEAIADLEKGKQVDPVEPSAVASCLQDGEKGQAVTREVSKRVRLLWRETKRSILLETRDQARQDAWLHKTYVAKKADVAGTTTPPASNGPRRSAE
jgi:hypothetical protein